MIHSKLSPSASSRWLGCTASVKAIEEFLATNPALLQSSIYADEGTKAHELCELMLTNQAIKNDEYNDDILRHCYNYVDYIKHLYCTDEYIEQKVHIIEDIFGHVDFIGVDTDKVLHIVDFKYGAGVKVDVENNTQLMLYAIGAIKKLKYKEFPRVKLHIFQPRMNNIVSWDFVEIKEFYKKVKNTIENINSNNVEFKPSDKACRFCPVYGNCKALFNYTASTIKPLFDSLNEESNTLTNEDIKKILDNTSLIKKMLTKVEEEAFRRVANGETIDGYSIVIKLSNRKVCKEKAIELLGDAACTVKTKTLTELKKTCKEHGINIDDILEERTETTILSANKDNVISDLFEDLEV